ncbi:hypothetical protein [Streptomyces sp. NPDC005017]|uniref:hypothetical protein n=1 Tax=Streptomyces sp. NPDC005017 TaxID=3364706 RepID=UPI0036CE8DB6
MTDARPSYAVPSPHRPWPLCREGCGIALDMGSAGTRAWIARLGQDRSGLTAEALDRGVLLAGGGALRPDVTGQPGARLPASLRVVPAPHTAAVRGAARLLQAAHTRPAASGG